MSQTKEEEICAKRFEQHVVTQELNQGLFRSWRCARPNSGFCWFRVVTWPGGLHIGGDLDDFVFSRSPDMIYWAEDSIGDPDYMAQKVVAGKTREFSEEALRAWLTEWAEEIEANGGDATEIRDLLEEDVVTIEKAYSLPDVDEVPSCMELSVPYLVAIAALKWFLKEIKA